jgi:hypothetical protein
MRVPTSGERKLAHLDFIRLKKFTAAGKFPQLAGILDDAERVPSRSIPPDVATMNARSWVRPAREETVAQIEGILFQPEATGDYVT